MLGKVNCKNVQLMNKTEAYCFRDYKYYVPCDALLTAALLFPEKCITTKRQCHATVELHGHYSRGQMIVDHLGINEHNVTIIETMDVEEMKNALLWTAAS